MAIVAGWPNVQADEIPFGGIPRSSPLNNIMKRQLFLRELAGENIFLFKDSALDIPVTTVSANTYADIFNNATPRLDLDKSQTPFMAHLYIKWQAIGGWTPGQVQGRIIFRNEHGTDRTTDLTRSNISGTSGIYQESHINLLGPGIWQAFIYFRATDSNPTSSHKLRLLASTWAHLHVVEGGHFIGNLTPLDGSS